MFVFTSVVQLPGNMAFFLRFTVDYICLDCERGWLSSGLFITPCSVVDVSDVLAETTLRNNLE